MFRSPIIKQKFLQIPDYQKEKEKKIKKTSIEKYNATNYARYINFNPHNTNREKIEYPELQLSIKKCIYKFEKEKNFNLTKYNLEFPKTLKTSLPKILLEKNQLSFTKNKYTSRNKKIFNYSREQNSYQDMKNNCFFVIRPENCGYLIEKCFEHRINWKKMNENIYNSFNFKWQQNIIGIDFSNLSKVNGIKQMVNHYEFHYCISNKANLFQNLIKYCEMRNENIFKYIPFTIIFDYENDKYIETMENFEKLVDDINDYEIKYNEIKLISERKKENKIYSNFFSLYEKLGNKTPIIIPSTHLGKNNGNLWIIKAPNLNRGRYIKIINSTYLLKKHIKHFSKGINIVYSSENEKNSYQIINQNTYKSNIVVVQKYIEKPLLYFGRKFDIRIWVLLTHKMEVYMFNEGHLKICSIDYNINSNDNYSHLTNYSFQKKNVNFSRYEYGNEVSFDDLQHNIDYNYYNSKINFRKDIIPKIKKIIEITFKSVKRKINLYNRNYTFEIFGFDFMLDEEFNPFLIEVNTNPGLEESSPLIKMLIPRMIDDALRLTVDNIFNTLYSFDKNLINDNYCNTSNDKCIYKSPFPVNGYYNSENLFKFVCDCKEKDDRDCIKLKFNKLKINKHKLNDE